MLEDVIDELQNIIDSDPGKEVVDKVEDALATVETALDERNKVPPDHQAEAGNIEGAVGDLEAAVGSGLLAFTPGTDLMDDLAAIAREIAAEAVAEAIAQGGNPEVIAAAQQALDDGDTLRDSGAFKDAVSQYRDALAKAENVLP